MKPEVTTFAVRVTVKTSKGYRSVTLCKTPQGVINEIAPTMTEEEVRGAIESLEAFLPPKRERVRVRAR